MTDCILFATLFATYAVLRSNFNGGPTPHELFDLSFVLTETLLLLISSFTCGIAQLHADQRHRQRMILWLGITFLLGLAFLGMELTEFTHLVREDYSWQRSAFLSAYFTLVGTHGLHITTGLLWIAVLMGQLLYKGITTTTYRRMACFSLFWHFLDIIWIFIFTFVYLVGLI
jgi:cytochrome o ubiquinol oxidase subunit 3